MAGAPEATGLPTAVAGRYSRRASATLPALVPLSRPESVQDSWELASPASRLDNLGGQIFGLGPGRRGE